MPKKPSEAQHLATMNNLCLATIARLAANFNRAGHYDFEMLAHNLDAQFRAKLLEKGNLHGTRR